jgi:hypothetical protein
MSDNQQARALPPMPLTRRTMLKGAAAGLAAPLGGLIETSRVRAAVARQEGNGTTTDRRSRWDAIRPRSPLPVRLPVDNGRALDL